MFDTTLVQQFAPVLCFHQDEHFFPVSPEGFIRGCSLHQARREGDEMLLPPGVVAPEDLGDPYFADSDRHLVYASMTTAQEAEAAAIQAWLERQQAARGVDFQALKKELKTQLMGLGVQLAQVFKPFHSPEGVFAQALAKYGGLAQHPPVYHARVTQEGGYRVIQYWYFYPYNDFATSHGGVNDHEGDWECIHLYLQGDAPQWLAYSAHGGHGADLRRAWGAVQKEGDHPVAYVAAGSHANYFTPELEPPEKPFKFGPVIGTMAVPWEAPGGLDAPWCTTYRGRWGARWDTLMHRTFEAHGGPPTGPRFTRTGEERVEYAHPLVYAGLGA